MSMIEDMLGDDNVLPNGVRVPPSLKGDYYEHFNVSPYWTVEDEDQITGATSWRGIPKPSVGEALGHAQAHHEQSEDGGVRGIKLVKLLDSWMVLGTDHLAYFLEHLDKIEPEWDGKRIFFWGTIYRNLDGSLLVCYLEQRSGKWVWAHRWLQDLWGPNDLVAMF